LILVTILYYNFANFFRKYVPVLKKYPEEYIYEPWKAPLSVQRAAGCIIGQDYPRLIVKHEEVYKVNIAKMNAAYKNNKLNKAANGNFLLDCCLICF